MNTKRLILTYVAVVGAAVAVWAGEPCDSVPADSVKARADYPERLITEFPVIYAVRRRRRSTLMLW